MGKTTGFMEFERETPRQRAVADRIRDFREIYEPFAQERLQRQAARCMDCGTPTCHAGCPLGNLIPDWNDQIFLDNWAAAAEQLLSTHNFPEFTGRLCPAPCEEACVLSINAPPVTIELIEKEIIERAFARGWIRPEPPLERTGKTVAVVGSGPAGLACAQQLNRAGHRVVVFERSDRIGGLLRYGIPDFKLEKRILDRRLALMAAEGVEFRTGEALGDDLTPKDLEAYDAVTLCIGATAPRDLPVPGRELAGIHFAMDFLTRQNRLVAGDDLRRLGLEPISARGRHVIVIGGGDTGSDCIGTCHRQQARSVTNFELLPEPPPGRPRHHPWPFWPMRLRLSSSHQEGGERHWGILTRAFEGNAGRVTGVTTVAVEFEPQAGGAPAFKEIPGSERRHPADLVLLALGFRGPETDAFAARFGLTLDARGNFKTDENYMTSVAGIFAAGDARRGQSLVVWAISEGREAAACVDRYLMGHSRLPRKGGGDLPRI